MKHLMLILLVSTTMFGANQGAQRAPMSYNRMSYDGAMATLRAYRPEQWDANSFQRIKPYLDRASLQEQGQFLDDFTRAMGSSEASLPYHRAMLYQGLFGEDSALKK